MSVLVVIVNYRTPALTIDCLRSLAPEIARVSGARAIVTDNLSSDDSVPQIRRAIHDNAWGDWCTFVPLPKNGGFAYGNDEAIRAGLTTEIDFVWLLNPDTIVLPGAMTELVNFLKNHPQVGIAGGRAENRDGTVRRSSFRYPTPLGELEEAMRFAPLSKALKHKQMAPPVSDVPVRADWVSGASMMVRRDVFDRVGLLDDGYFMYYEETDFCIRATRAGFECWYVPASRIIHLVGQSSGVTGAAKAAKRRPKYVFDSRRRFFSKNHGWLTLQIANLCWLVGYPIGTLWQRSRGKRRNDPPKLWWDFLRYNYFPNSR